LVRPWYFCQHLVGYRGSSFIFQIDEHVIPSRFSPAGDCALSAKDYLWSGYNHEVEGIVNKVLDLDSNHRVLGNTQQERQSAHKEYVTQTIPDEELHLIRQAIQRNQLTGSDRFRMYLEKKHKVVISNRGQGRPKKAKK
jgi:hypothetical protein